MFDHLRTTAAIAVCLHLAAESTDSPFLLVAADLTGIQKYIYGIRPGSGGLARRLRARSFQVAAYLESVSLGLLDRLQLPIAQRILFAGGKFYLLLPNTPQTAQILDQARIEVSERLFDTSAGEMGLALASMPIAEDGLTNFPATLHSVNSKLRESRDRAGEAVLAESRGWRESRFLLTGLTPAGGQELCEYCGRRPGRPVRQYEEQVVTCELCEREQQIGRQLPQSRHVAFVSNAQIPGVTSAPLGGFRLLRRQDRPAGHELLVVDLDGTGDGHPADPVFGAYRARYIPIAAETGTPVEFGDLAHRSQGRPALGYLKLDVDNLGFLFSQGFRASVQPQDDEQGQVTETRDRTSISRVASLSRTLEIFFAGYVETLLRQFFPNVYLIYSGGDDLVAVGPWNEMFDLALRIRNEFGRFTAGNAAFTLSAGIAVTHYHLPVLSAIEEADTLLEASKTVPGNYILPWPMPATTDGAPQKDRVTVFDTSLPWRAFEAVLDRAKTVLGWIQDGTLSTRQLRRLLTYAEMEREFALTRDTRHLQYIPYLARDLRRTWAEKTPAQQQARRWAAGLATPDSADMKSVHFICQYALYGNRHSAAED